MTTQIQSQPGLPPSDYAPHVERVLTPPEPKTPPVAGLVLVLGSLAITAGLCVLAYLL